MTGTIKTCDNCGKEERNPPRRLCADGVYRGWITVKLDVARFDTYDICSMECLEAFAAGFIRHFKRIES